MIEKRRRREKKPKDKVPEEKEERCLFGPLEVRGINHETGKLAVV